MPASRFALYFLALAACSTIAFGSGFAGRIASSDGTAALDATAERPFTAAERAVRYHHYFHPPIAQLARSD